MSGPDLRHLNQVQLARRWGMSERTLEGWRSKRRGPAYMRLGGRIAYRLADVEQFEAAHIRLVSKDGERS